jgi:hypothetical protein
LLEAIGINVAIWQFDLFIIRPGSLPSLTDDGLDFPALPQELTASATQYLNANFATPFEMLPDWLVFGQENGNRVNASLEASFISELSIRIDARDINHTFIASVCEFTRLLNCVFFIPESKAVVEPTPELVLLALQNSRSAQFVKGPKDFLNSIANGF